MHHIPKRVHVTWCDKQIWYNDLTMLKLGIHNLRRLNRDWEVCIWDDSEIRQYVKCHISEHDWHLLQNKHIVEVSDLWRLILMFKEGGIYIDIDRLCNVELDSLFSPKLRCFLPTYLDQDFSHDIMISTPENPIYAKARDLNMSRRRDGCDNIYFLGPQTYMHAITECLTGNIINSSPDLSIFKQLRHTIDQTDFLSTYREDPPFNTLLQRGPKLGDWQAWKDEMYSHYKIKHWTES